MPRVNLQQAKEFLEEISSEDNFAVIHHDDTDGFVSGILFYDWCRKKGAGVEHFCFSNSDNQEDLIKNLNPFNKFLISDLGPGVILKILEFVKDKGVLYVDHHQKDIEIPESILEYRTESRVSASKSVYSMTGGKKWLKVSSVLADVGRIFDENKLKIKKFAKEYNLNEEELNKDFYLRIDFFLDYFYKDKNKTFEILREVNSYEDLKEIYKYSDVVENEVSKFVEGYEDKKEKLGFVNFYYFEPKFPIKSGVTTSISFKFPDEVFVFATPIENNKINLSARNQSGKINCAELLKKAIEGFKDANAGGHSQASGGYIKKDDLKKFKENLERLG